jgi:hypothetical protein
VLNLSHDGLERNGPVVAAKAVQDGDEIILTTAGGQTIRTTVSPEQYRVLGRSTSGVRAIAVPEGDRLVSMAWVRPAGGNGGETDVPPAAPPLAPDEPPPEPAPEGGRPGD